MTNERLRRAMLHAGLDGESLAERLGVSAKTVERWLSAKTIPYPKARHRVAMLLGQDESYLWPEASDRTAVSNAEVLATYPRRTDVPKHLWTELLAGASRSVDVLAFAGLFLTEEHADWLPTLRQKATDGVRIRVLLGDPGGRQLAERDSEHSIAGGVAGRVAGAFAHYELLASLLQLRLHDTPLYNSIYRFDDDMIVNTHLYGILAPFTPCLRFRRMDGSYFNSYLESFEYVWASAKPWSANE